MSAASDTEAEIRRLRAGWDEWQRQALELEAENERLRKVLGEIAKSGPWSEVARKALAGDAE